MGVEGVHLFGNRKIYSDHRIPTEIHRAESKTHLRAPTFLYRAASFAVLGDELEAMDRYPGLAS